MERASASGAVRRAALRTWVGVRVLAPVLVLVLAPELPGKAITHLPDVHGTVKTLLLTWQSLLLRQERVLGVLAAGALGGAPLARTKGRAWWILLLATALSLVFLVGPKAWWVAPVALALLAANALPADVTVRLRAAALVPGSGLLLPVPVYDALAGPPRLRTLAGALAGLLVAGGWVVADTIAAFPTYEHELLAAWPDDRVDSRVTTVARAPAGVKCDFHDIDVLEDRVVVVAEGQRRLLSFPKSGGPPASWPLPAPWGPAVGLTMDSETDAARGRTWYLSGPNVVAELAWDGDAWSPSAHATPFRGALHHTYMAHLPERNELVLLTIGTQNMLQPPSMVVLPLPGLGSPVVRRLLLPDGSTPPTFRDFTWVRSIGRFVLAPDFGDRLYLGDPDTGRVESWLPTPTLDGRPVWIPDLDRVLVPLPNRAEIWLVDPKKGVVDRRIPTQPGVRTAAVDAGRGLLLTASTLTGRVLVQRLDDGAIVDRFGTVMPMVRNLVADPTDGTAWLSTWTALYRIPYASDVR